MCEFSRNHICLDWRPGALIFGLCNEKMLLTTTFENILVKSDAVINCHSAKEPVKANYGLSTYNWDYHFRVYLSHVSVITFRTCS